MARFVYKTGNKIVRNSPFSHNHAVQVRPLRYIFADFFRERDVMPKHSTYFLPLGCKLSKFVC